jgi:hypothetical protein
MERPQKLPSDELRKRHAQSSNKWYWRNREAALSRMREYRIRNPDKRTPKDLSLQRVRRVYGINADEYTAMLADQDGKCAICGEVVEVGGRGANGAAIDHDHTDGRVRGILCSHCNSAIGFMQDNPGRLRMAAAYLERNAK